jgi:hypothetical protein
MTLKQAFFILRHGSAEGNHKYLEAVKVIEDEYNRQKETIKQLQTALFKCGEDMAEMQETINHQKAEIEEYQKHIDNDIIYVKAVKTEAVKEFAEIIKANQRVLFNYIYSRDGFVEIIDNLVKEFTGGADADRAD